jgi:tetratricopeptide (TPR) repeat protein
MPRLSAAVAIALAALAADTLGSVSLPSRKDAWIRVETAHFTLFSDASESKTKEVGANLEKLRAVLLLLKQTATSSSPVPTFVFVFKSDAALEPYKPMFRGKPSRTSGFFEASNDGNYIALSAGWNMDPRPVIFHEYLHYFLHSNFPRQPLWYDEGLAEFYSTFQATSSEARIGLPVENHVWRLRSETLLPLEKLFAVRPDSPEYNEESRQGLFYAESWALVHYLMRGEVKRTPQLGRFLVLLQQGRPQDEAFREAFQTDYAGLLRELTGYVRGTSFAYRRIGFADLKLSAEARTEAIGHEEALVRLGDLLAHGHLDRGDEAEAHFQAVLAAAPSHAGALAGMGLLRLRRDRFGEAADFFRRAIVSGSRDFRTYFRHGELLMHALSDQPFRPGHLEESQRQTIEEARAAFRKSIEWNPEFAEAHAALGKTYLFEDGANVSEGIAELEAAVAKLPSRKDLTLDLAELYDRRGEEGKGEELLKRALGPEAEPILARRRSQNRLREALDRVNALLNQGKEEEAITRLEQIVSAAPADAGEILSEQLKELRRGAAKNLSVREYNDAVERYKKRDLEGALAGFERVAATAADSDLVKAAQEHAQLVRRLLSRKPRTPPGSLPVKKR